MRKLFLSSLACAAIALPSIAAAAPTTYQIVYPSQGLLEKGLYFGGKPLPQGDTSYYPTVLPIDSKADTAAGLRTVATMRDLRKNGRLIVEHSANVPASQQWASFKHNGLEKWRLSCPGGITKVNPYSYNFNVYAGTYASVYAGMTQWWMQPSGGAFFQAKNCAGPNGSFNVFFSNYAFQANPDYVYPGVSSGYERSQPKNFPNTFAGLLALEYSSAPIQVGTTSMSFWRWVAPVTAEYDGSTKQPKTFGSGPILSEYVVPSDLKKVMAGPIVDVHKFTDGSLRVLSFKRGYQGVGDIMLSRRCIPTGTELNNSLYRFGTVDQYCAEQDYTGWYAPTLKQFVIAKGTEEFIYLPGSPQVMGGFIGQDVAGLWYKVTWFNTAGATALNLQTSTTKPALSL